MRMRMRMRRDGRPDPERPPLGRRFKLHWGEGAIAEEARIETRYHEPAIQLLQFDSGLREIRFCAYRDGAFSRMPLIVDEADMERLGRALADCPRLLAAFERLVKAARKARRAR